MWNATVLYRGGKGERTWGQVLELGHAQISDGDEVDGRLEAARGALGLLKRPVHGLDEGVGAVVDPAAHDGLKALGQREGELLERLRATAARPEV